MPVDVDATWLNPVAYDAAELRRADAALLASDGSALGVLGGIAHPDALTVTVDASDNLTLQPGALVVSGDYTVAQGPYRMALGAPHAELLTGRDLTNDRIDLVVGRVLDTDVVGTHGAFTGRFEVIAGTPSATPSAPALPSMARELARLEVPADGGGAVTVDSTHRTYACALGGLLLVEREGMLPTSASIHQRAKALDTGVEYAWTGSTWGITSPAYAKRQKGSFQSYSHATLTQVGFADLVASNRDAFNTGSGDELAIPEAGFYEIVVQHRWDPSDDSGHRYVEIRVNDKIVAGDTMSVFTGAGIAVSDFNLCSHSDYFDSGDIVTAFAYQTSGGTLQSASDSAGSYMQIRQLRD